MKRLIVLVGIVLCLSHFVYADIADSWSTGAAGDTHGGPVTIAGTLDVTGVTTLNSSMTVVGKTTLKGDYVHVGDGGTVTYVDGDGDLYVEDELEVDGISQFTGRIEARGGIKIYDTFKLNLDDAGIAPDRGKTQVLFFLQSGTGRQLILGDYVSRNMNYDHAITDDPTLFIHSVQQPDIDNTQWFSMSYSSDNVRAEFDTGGGDFYFKKSIETTSDLTVNGTFYYNASSAEIAMQDNTDGTTVTTSTSTFVQIEGTYTSDDLIGFTVSGSSFTYTGLGGANKKFKVDCNASLLTNQTNTIVHLAVYKNGDKVSFSASRKIAVSGDEGNHTIIDTLRLSQGDIVQIRVSGDKSATITAEHITIIIHQLN